MVKKSIIDALDALQASKNEGRGVTAVRTVVIYLQRDDLSSALAVMLNEGDKISNYIDIVRFLVDNVIPQDADNPYYRLRPRKQDYAKHPLLRLWDPKKKLLKNEIATR